MAHKGYGLHIGTLTGVRREIRHASPHAVLLVQPRDQRHPPYRVAVNTTSTAGRDGYELQYCSVDLLKGSAEARKFVVELSRAAPTARFVRADGCEATAVGLRPRQDH